MAASEIGMFAKACHEAKFILSDSGYGTRQPGKSLGGG
jgi:hypothetical protein